MEAASSDHRPLIYAELLSNIRQISVIVVLDSPCDPATKVKLSPDGRRFILDHGYPTSLGLPGQVAPYAKLQRPTLGSKEISWRLPLAGQTTRSERDEAQSSEAPWSANDLDPAMEFSCCDCGAIVVRKETIKQWKDLPSENWAEMMEFWHCHKPDIPEEENAGPRDQLGNTIVSGVPLDSKGYGANSKFAASTGIGLVNLTTFLFVESDCVGLKSLPLSDSRTKVALVECASCNNYIGETDPQAEGLRLFKWRLSHTSSLPSGNFTSYTKMPVVVSSQINAVMRAQCLSRLVLTSSPNAVPTVGTDPPSSPTSLTLSRVSTHSVQTKYSPTRSPKTNGRFFNPSRSSSLSSLPISLHFWILSPSLRFSSTSAASARATRSTRPPSGDACETITQCPKNEGQSDEVGTFAMKVFWKSVTADEAQNLTEDPNVEEVHLPAEAIAELKECLQESASLLPPSIRKFQGWDVGLLERYED